MMVFLAAVDADHFHNGFLFFSDHRAVIYFSWQCAFLLSQEYAASAPTDEKTEQTSVAASNRIYLDHRTKAAEGM
jgi:hypothetical protein